MEKISYALGVSLGTNLKNSGFTSLDTSKLAEGIGQVVEGKELEMSIDEAQALVNAYFQELEAKAYEKTIQEGKEFLEKNAGRAEVVTTASGLQYEVLSDGTG